MAVNVVILSDHLNVYLCSFEGNLYMVPSGLISMCYWHQTMSTMTTTMKLWLKMALLEVLWNLKKNCKKSPFLLSTQITKTQCTGISCFKQWMNITMNTHTMKRLYFVGH